MQSSAQVSWQTAEEMSSNYSFSLSLSVFLSFFLPCLSSLIFFPHLLFSPQQFGKILDVEIIFNERGSKVSQLEEQFFVTSYFFLPTGLLFPSWAE